MQESGKAWLPVLISGNAGNAGPAKTPAVDRPGSAAQQAGIPAAEKPPEQKARDGIQNVGSISDDNPLLVVDAGEVPKATN